MLSKLFSKSALAKLVSRLAPKQGMVAMTVRSFAAGKEVTVEKGRGKLSKALNREIKYEKENHQEDDTIDVI